MSSTFLNNCAEQAEAAIKRGQQPVILHGGDLDPSGIAIPRSYQNKIKQFYGIDVVVDRFALTPEQNDTSSLPVDYKAAKEQDPNYKRFVEQFGTLAVELEALHPEEIKTKHHDHNLGEKYDTWRSNTKALHRVCRLSL